MRDVSNAISVLWEKARTDLSLEELDQLAECDELAERKAINLACVVDNLASIVCQDGSQKIAAGNFQDANQVTELLCVIADDIATIGALIHLGAEARYRAGELRSTTA